MQELCLIIQSRHARFGIRRYSWRFTAILQNRQAGCCSNGYGYGRLAEVQKIISALPTEQREVLLLVCVEDLAYREAAEILGVPTGTRHLVRRHILAKFGLLLIGDTTCNGSCDTANHGAYWASDNRAGCRTRSAAYRLFNFSSETSAPLAYNQHDQARLRA